MLAPAVILLAWLDAGALDDDACSFRLRKYLPLRGDSMANGLEWVGFANYTFALSAQALSGPVCRRPLMIVGVVCLLSPSSSALFSRLLLDQPMWGQGIVRILVIAPFFVMPTVSALVWKNMFMDPVNGLFAYVWKFFGAAPVEWLSSGLDAIDCDDRKLAMAAFCDA